jgi:predicted PurR-regulated permease PerM
MNKMNSPVQTQPRRASQSFLFWCFTALLFILILTVFSSVLLPFVLGITIAYLLEPIVNYMAQRKIPRWAAAALILLCFAIFIGIICALAFPVIYRQIQQLIMALPSYAEHLWTQSLPYVSWVEEILNQENNEKLKENIRGSFTKIFDLGGGILASVVSGGQALVGLLTTSILTPIIAYYMMKEWPNMTSWFKSLWPRKYFTTIEDLLGQMNRKISGFIRGQLTVSFLLGIGYAIALSIAGLNYGFLIGIMAGVFSIIPMVGSTLGLIIATTVAYLQSGELSFTLIIASIFLIGQFIEGNIISPKLLGDSVGLHPLWILFALLAGGSLFGIVGMIVAVPMAAVIGVLAQFVIKLYKLSPYFDEAPKQVILEETKTDTDIEIGEQK